MTKGLTSSKGTECNKVKIGGITELYGDPNIQIEKPYTIVIFPGGCVEISRTTDGQYWVHVATSQSTPDDPKAMITMARVDSNERYCDELNTALDNDIEKGDINHIAFRVTPQ